MNPNSSIIDRAKIFVKELYEKKIPSSYSYHNFDHTMEVYEAGIKLAKEAKLEKNETEILLLASLFHDTGFSVGREDHEEHSKKIAKKFLEKEAYDKAKTKEIMVCINATKMTITPETKLEKMMKDADLSGLSSIDFQEHASKIRKEFNHFLPQKISKEEWINKNYNFLKSYNYYSEPGIKLFGPQKLKNQVSLKNMIESMKDKKKPVPHTIANTKSAQVQFKTALRNHIDLSSIADNKANIMLSVNALIITVALPILAETIRSIPLFLFPTISLLFVSIISMIFATLATRPIKMGGKTSLSNVVNKKSNLFFFGNFYKMDFNDYEEGIKEVIAREDVLDNSITRDLFYLGQALGSKYNNLRWCYNIFMYGIIFSVLLFAGVFIIQNN